MPLPSSLVPQYLEYYGNPNLIVKHIGRITTDYYGLDTGLVEWVIKSERAAYAGPSPLSRHPVWGWLYLEKKTIDIVPGGFAEITGEYVGIQGGTTRSIFECSTGTQDEPIETHPKFVSDIAGKPSAPLNGAIFIDPSTGIVTTDDTLGQFVGFKGTLDGARNPLAGVQAYLSPQAVVREVWYSEARVSAGAIGRINTPSVTPGLGGGINWLLTGVAFQQRGTVYQNTKEWRSSGLAGWNTTIYS